MTFSINAILYRMVAIRLEPIFLTMTRHAMIFLIKMLQYMRYLMGGFVDSTLFCYICRKICGV